jgi:ACR3 family arsenite efflux pump ArsB
MATKKYMEMKQLSHNYKYWVMNLLHNWLVHPLLPIADIFMALNCRKVSDKIYLLHELTCPTLWLEG